MKCEHGCGTELSNRETSDGKRFELAAESPPFTNTTKHTPERCQKATRALLDEARGELIETKEKRDRELHVTLELLQQRDAAEKRAMEAERERRLAEDELHGEVIAHAAHHTSENDCSDKSPCFHCQRRNAATLVKLVEAERERDGWKVKTSEPLAGPKALCSLCLTWPATTLSTRRELDICAICSGKTEKEGAVNREQWKSRDRECAPCPRCGTEMYEQFWGEGGWVGVEKATGQSHQPRDCDARLLASAEAWKARAQMAEAALVRAHCDLRWYEKNGSGATGSVALAENAASGFNVEWEKQVVRGAARPDEPKAGE